MGSDCGSSGYDCGESYLLSNSLYKPNCCFWARMTAIAQTNTNVFNDGSAFSGIAKSNSELGTGSGMPLSYAPWANGGVQDWPNDKTRILLSNYSVTGETDEVDLHP
jgi:hypothetical protein